MNELRENVSLAEYTTIKLGGTARYFVECGSVEEIRAAVTFAKSQGIPFHILGHGSNTIFRDEGFAGLVLKIALKGIQFIREGEEVKMVCAAGEVWDQFVQLCISYHLAGVECLSGIPGLVGATPIQNVGAYGQDVAETIVDVKALNRRTLEEVHFTNEDCRFAYRRSRFNEKDVNSFIITEVAFKLRYLGEPHIRYPELQKFIEASVALSKLEAGCAKLQAVRNAVLSLRRKKSMVIDETDPNSRSVGSFFKNPVLSREAYIVLEKRCRASDIGGPIPTFSASEGVKIPAAWLLEQVGFTKGFRKRGVGVSTNHALALVNYGGTSSELLALAREIQTAVLEKFGVTLEQEPVFV